MKLDCQNLSYRYPGTTKTILKDISFTIENSGFHALFGPSGVGKTSFAKILAQMVNGHDGNIIRSGERILYTYNLERLPGWASVGSHLDKITPSARLELQQSLIDIFGLREIMAMRFSTLSLGQKNRINLLRYLMQDFDTLIMDESLANVDESTRETILLKIKTLFPDKFLLYISHNVVEVAKFCDRIVVFRSKEKVPQVKLVRGTNAAEGQEVDDSALNRSILEIMHAA